LPDTPPSLQDTFQKGGLGAVASALPGNILRSGASTLGGIGSALINTINPDLEHNTIANLGRIGLGAVQYAQGDKNSKESQMAQTAAKFYDDRYGISDLVNGNIGSAFGKVGNTLFNDPVGSAIDASMVLDMGGSALGKIGDIGKIEALVNAGKIAKDVGSAVNPLNALGKIVSPVAENVLGKVGDVVQGAGENLSMSPLKASAAQKTTFSDLTGSNLKDFVKDNNLYWNGETAAAKVDKNFIQPLQDQYNSMVRTGTPISGDQYAQALQSRAMDILNRDRSPAARALANKLWEEGNQQAALGDITDTVLTNSKTSAYNKVSNGVMTDPLSDNVNKEMGNVARQVLDQVAPGSADLGKKLQAYRAFEDIALKNAEKGSGLTGLMNTSIGGTIGSAIGTATGNPVLGAAAGIGLGYASQNPNVLSGIGKGAEIAGEGLGKLPPMLGRAIQSGIAPSLIMKGLTQNQTDGQNNNETQNDSQHIDPSLINTSQSNTQSDPSLALPNQTGSLGSIPQATAQMQGNTNGSNQTELSQTPGASPSDSTNGSFLNPLGWDPARLYRAANRAFQAHDMRNYEYLSSMAQMELSNQRYLHPKMTGRSATLLGNTQVAINQVSDLTKTLDKTYGSVMGPIQGRIRSYDPAGPVGAYESRMNVLSQSIAQATGGDQKTIYNELPSITDTPVRAKQKLNSLLGVLKDDLKTRTQYLKNSSDIGVGASPADAGVGQ